ncbi:CBL-interacting serine/threonine-protein kinase 15 [Sarcoptes scabiei]|uniref:CBL-interacting serine/threonine-protein kinase 15 n=1 Tax=Sarcoptes scabiei TaxID=52283 RepID=A0A834R1X4_SARSC|nr:CBL-interacting serine/threonine-protein kinase 15 [Sarcoptes scabiei]
MIDLISTKKLVTFDDYKCNYRATRIRLDRHRIESLMKSKHIDSIDFVSVGRFSNVFCGIHRKSNKSIIIKVVLKEELAKSGGSIIKRTLPYDQLFLSDKISKTYEIFTTRSYLIVLSDYYEENLAQLLLANRGPMREQSVHQLFRLILSALNHMHSLKIAHRNLKLENIMLKDSSWPVLADFNYTIVVEDLGDASKLFSNTSLYSAPEINSHRPYDPMVADVWNLGICLFVILTNSFPFPSAVYVNDSNYLNSFMEMDKILSDQAKSTLELMLEFDPNRRIVTEKLSKNSWFS